MNIPIVSIIVPVFNAEHILATCLDSVLIQTFTNFELLLVNDGSTDSSGIICDSYSQKDHRVKVFHKKNGGVSSARNLGLDKACGSWITFVDSDDWVEQNWLAVFFANIDDADIVAQGFFYHLINGETFYSGVTDNKKILEASVFLDLLSEKRMVGYVWNKMFRRSIINKNNIRFNENYQIHEDVDFVLEYLSKNVSARFALERGEYHYIKPDLSKKYKDKRNFYCYIDLIVSLKKIYGQDYSKHQLFTIYINWMGDILTQSFKEGEINKTIYFEMFYTIANGKLQDVKFAKRLYPLFFLRFLRQRLYWNLTFRCMPFYTRIYFFAEKIKRLLSNN